MKTSTIILLLPVAAFAAVTLPSSSLSFEKRSIKDLKRVPSDTGFTHMGSDNVVRTFDSDFNVIDFAQIDSRDAAAQAIWPQGKGPREAAPQHNIDWHGVPLNDDDDDAALVQTKREASPQHSLDWHAVPIDATTAADQGKRAASPQEILDWHVAPLDTDTTTTSAQAKRAAAPQADLWPRVPSTAVLAEAKRARARSEAHVSKPRRSRNVFATAQSCVSEFCPDDGYCRGLSIYGYSCGWCLMVLDGEGNCQGA